jgi:hypothetical protein
MIIGKILKQGYWFCLVICWPGSTGITYIDRNDGDLFYVGEKLGKSERFPMEKRKRTKKDSSQVMVILQSWGSSFNRTFAHTIGSVCYQGYTGVASL